MFGVLAHLGERFIVLLRTLRQRLAECGFGLCLGLRLSLRLGLADGAVELFGGAVLQLGELRSLRAFGLAACLLDPVGHFLLQLGQLPLGQLRL